MRSIIFFAGLRVRRCNVIQTFDNDNNGIVFLLLEGVKEESLGDIFPMLQMQRDYIYISRNQ